ncbi:MAG: S-adenosylmethionine--diacylglycerol 3-amino-3-carboxypropyl transferase [Rhodomicrobium sp.]|nr:MAG: S-adenosylmethionine--diacylglycerol 3-amino-3-carboxypropyl transferase [Rhodomicrobium sp.]
MTMPATIETPKPARAKLIRNAVRTTPPLNSKGLLEQLFAQLFSGLVYPQIWEDPLVDLQAMAIEPHHHIMTIASGGCNVMSYLTANPGKITAVDLNRAHVALTKTKIATANTLPDWAHFHKFWAIPNATENETLYERYVETSLDETTKKHWRGRDATGRRRLRYFSENLYHHGMLGRFIGLCHFMARRYGIRFEELLTAATHEEQTAYFETKLKPLMTKRLIRWLTSHPASLYGLGIPPAQYEALAASGGGNMTDVLTERLRKLCCDFDIEDNYFAWQAFGRRYGGNGANALPPYLQQHNFETIKSGAAKVSVFQNSVTDQLRSEPPASLDRLVLLDAQDWMDDKTLNDLWDAITIAAAPKARVIFRTAGAESILPGRVAPEILDQWNYQEERSVQLNKQDRSAIYGGFHIYELTANAKQ